MHKAPADTAHVLILPPLLYGAACGLGILLHLLWPIAILPSTLARGVGGLCILGACTLASMACRVLWRVHTPVDPLRPTTTLVTTGPFRYSRNPLYLALTTFYVGVACLANALGLLLLVVPALVVLRYGVIAREEAYLARKFGAAYQQYTMQTRRWF